MPDDIYIWNLLSVLSLCPIFLATYIYIYIYIYIYNETRNMGHNDKTLCKFHIYIELSFAN